MDKKTDKLRIALPKGSLMEPTLKLLADMGYDTEQIQKKSRKLSFATNQADFIIARATDVPTYVMYGAVDLGFVGKDVLMESTPDVFELLDLGYGRCKFILAGPEDEAAKTDEYYRRLGRLRVATKYPNVTKNYFERRELQVEIIKLYGSIELAPLAGLADRIVDLLSTGKTLAENNLQVIEEIAPISCRLIANYVSNKLKSNKIINFVTQLEKNLI